VAISGSVAIAFDVFFFVVVIITQRKRWVLIRTRNGTAGAVGGTADQERDALSECGGSGLMVLLLLLVLVVAIAHGAARGLG